MKLSTTEKIMKVWGWISLVILILGIPTYFINFFVLKQEIEFSLFIPLIVSSLVEMLLSIALIRCKKDSFLVVAVAGQVLYRIASIIMNLSSVSVLAFINLAVYVVLLLFVAVNCIEKLSGYRTKANKFWFVPIIVMVVVSIIGFIMDLNEKISNTAVYENVQNAGNEIAVQTFSLGIGVSSTILGILPYLLLCYWLYKSYKVETEFE